MSGKLKITIKKYKWFIIILIIIFVVGCFYFIQSNARKNECKDRCCYMAGADCWRMKSGNKLQLRQIEAGRENSCWIYETIEEHSGIFETRGQCIDYCLRHK